MRARVNPDVASVKADISGNETPMTREVADPRIWSAEQPKVDEGSVRLTIHAFDSSGTQVAFTTPEEEYACSTVGQQDLPQAEEAGQVVDVLVEGGHGDEHLGVG